MKRIRSLQKRMGIKNRSRFFREVVRRYEKLQSDYGALHECLEGYLKTPEKPGMEPAEILKANLKNLAPEDW